MKLEKHLFFRVLVLIRNIHDWLIAQCVFGVMGFLRLFPANIAINFMENIGRRFGIFLPRTKVARKNLKQAFPEKSDEEIKKILIGMWGCFARTAAEYNYIDRIFDFDPLNPDKGRIEIAGVDVFAQLVADKKPAIFFTAHTGNWEILPVGAAAYGVEVIALFRPPNNKFIARKILSARRTKLGHLIPSKARASWALADILDNNGKIGILIDQYFYGRNAIEVDFFGNKAPANPLLARLVRQYNCSVYPTRCIRIPGGRFRLELQPKIEIPYLENNSVDVKKLTQMTNKIVEEWIREYPEQWLWAHNRWHHNRRHSD